MKKKNTNTPTLILLFLCLSFVQRAMTLEANSLLEQIINREQSDFVPQGHSLKTLIGDCDPVSVYAVLALQQVSVHTIPEDSVVCSVCGKTLKKRTIAVHQRTHTGERPFACPNCPKKFSDTSNLRRHKQTHTGEKLHTCTWPHCGKLFSQAHEVKRHMRIHTGEKPFPCLWRACDRAFTTKQQMQIHKRVHREERSFVCACGSGFAVKNRLIKHQQTCDSQSKSRKRKHASGSNEEKE